MRDAKEWASWLRQHARSRFTAEIPPFIGLTANDADELAALLSGDAAPAVRPEGESTDYIERLRDRVAEAVHSDNRQTRKEWTEAMAALNELRDIALRAASPPRVTATPEDIRWVRGEFERYQKRAADWVERDDAELNAAAVNVVIPKAWMFKRILDSLTPDEPEKS